FLTLTVAPAKGASGGLKPVKSSEVLSVHTGCHLMPLMVMPLGFDQSTCWMCSLPFWMIRLSPASIMPLKTIRRVACAVDKLSKKGLGVAPAAVGAEGD